MTDVMGSVLPEHGIHTTAWYEADMDGHRPCFSAAYNPCNASVQPHVGSAIA